MSDPSLTLLALSDLARAAAHMSSHSKPQTRFQVDHLVDTPGHLISCLEDASDGWDSPARQTLSFASNGVGVVILTGRDAVGAAEWRPGLPTLLVKQDSKASITSFTGYARPNPTFFYERGSVLEGIVVIEDEPRPLLYRHAIAIRELVELIANTAVSDEPKSPILSLHSPAQAPPHSHNRGDFRARQDEWPRASSISVRFAVALQTSAIERRFAFIDEVERYCRAHGYGFWVSDTRQGYRSGNWFGVAQHNRNLARLHHPRHADKDGDVQVRAVLPVTIVGPARVGSTSAILKYLANFRQIGVAGCSITALDDLAFIHLQLVVNKYAPRKRDVLSRELGRHLDGGDASSVRPVIPPRDFLENIVGFILGEGSGFEPKEMASIDGAKIELACKGFQVLAGTLIEVRHEKTKRVPIWTAWQVRGRDASIEPVLKCLVDVLQELSLYQEGSDLANVEYAICRLRRESTLRGKAKLSIRDSDVPLWAETSKIEGRAAVLCSEIEQRWRAKVHGAGLKAQVAVGDREHRVGHWSDWV